MNKMLITRHKWMILDYIGCCLPVLTNLQKAIIRQQLEERYCPHCGEYIYNPYKRRTIKHYHHSIYKKLKGKHLFYERMVVHPQSQLVEWTRRFPHVMRLVISERDYFFYNVMKPQFIHRIPALRMWTIGEWNLLYPEIPIKKDDVYKSITHSTKGDNLDYLYTPHLVL